MYSVNLLPNVSANTLHRRFALLCFVKTEYFSLRFIPLIQIRQRLYKGVRSREDPRICCKNEIYSELYRLGSECIAEN